MNKYIEKVEAYKQKTLGKALESLKSEYKEAADCYRDSGYDRYYKKMCRCEGQIEEIEKYMGNGEKKETELQADSYKELLMLRETIKNMKSKVFYLLYSQTIKFAKTYAALLVLLVFFFRGFVVTNVLGQICSKSSKS